MSMKEALRNCPFCGGPASKLMGLVGCEPCALVRRDAGSWNTRAPSPVAIPEGMPRLDPDLLRAFNRFCDTTEDFGADGYDVKPEKMVALAEFGVVRKVRGSVYETTAIGNWLRETLAISTPSPPSQPVGSAKCVCDLKASGHPVCDKPFVLHAGFKSRCVIETCKNSLDDVRACGHPRDCHPSTGEEKPGEVRGG
jgi:hypothetical protein